MINLNNEKENLAWLKDKLYDLTYLIKEIIEDEGIDETVKNKYVIKFNEIMSK